MYLSASEIRAGVASGELSIEPFDVAHLKPASYVLRLSDRWRRWSPSDEPVDLAAPVDTAGLLSPIVTSEEYVLSNTEFCLAATIERLSLPPHLMGIVAPLSHVARFGLSVGLGSFIVSPGFGANAPTSLTLELVAHNASPLRLRAGLPICHLALMKVTPASEAYPLDRSIYEGRQSPSGPLLAEEWNTQTLGPASAAGGHG